MNRVTLSQLKELTESARGSIDHIYLHWSAGHYGQFFKDYHITIDSDGSLWMPVDDLTETLSHTWRRNSNAIGVSMACCAFATSENLGSEPPTVEQVEAMAQVIAVLCKYLRLPCDISTVLTHGEAGDNMDSPSVNPHEPYGQNSTCERWDLAILANGQPWGSGGDILRGKGNWYMENSGL